MDIANIAGVTITLPGLLSGAWSALKFAYDLYGQVDLRRTQLKLFLDRCSDLLLRVAQSLPASEVDVSARMRENVDYLQVTCQSLRDVIDKLKRKGFLWCMLNQDKIDTQISDVQSRIADTFVLFNFNAHIGIEEFQQRLLQARDQDQAQLITKLNTLSENDQRILNALKYQDGVQRRVEELLVGVLRCVQNLGTDQSPQARFLRNASTVLQRASKGHIPDISADYVITSLEVDFQDTDSIGQGAFGRVFKGEWNGSRVAIKQMHIDNARTLSEDDRKILYREVRLWKGLHHPNILNLYGACLEANSPFLVMQYCPFGNMCDYLVEHPETNRVDILYDIVAGMTYLHNKGVVHADLKGANILIYKGVALVADFGLSAVIDGIQSRSALSSIAASVRGTPRWMAPECHKGEPPRKASDVYSLGLTMWEAFSGKIPYEDVRRHGLTFVIAVENRRPERPASLTETAIWDIIQECWAPVAEERPSIQKVQSKLSLYTTRLGSFVRTQSETTSSVLEQEWARSLRSGPPKWKRGSPRNDIDVLTILEPPFAQEVTSTSASASASGDAPLPTEEIAAAMARIKDDRVPTTPEEREKYFVSQVEKGEQLCTQGPEFAVEAALAFFRALRVYPSPVELITIFPNTVPEPVFKMVLEMMRLDVSDPPSSTSADETPPSTLSEDYGSASKRGPPSEASSQDWDQTSASASGDAPVPTEEIAAAMARIKDDRVPTTPEEREKYFVSQIEKGEQLCTQGPEFAVEAAVAFFRALHVYPSPVELITIFQNTVPEPIFKMVLEMMQLYVSDPPSSTSADEAPPSTLSEDDGSTSKRGPPSETSSQDWDQVTDPGSLTPPTA